MNEFQNITMKQMFNWTFNRNHNLSTLIVRIFDIISIIRLEHLNAYEVENQNFVFIDKFDLIHVWNWIYHKTIFKSYN